VWEPHVMPLTLQFSFHSGANFLLTKWLGEGKQGNYIIFLMKLFIFIIKISIKQKTYIYKSQKYFIY
jgi:hypothetical protein